MLCKQKVHQLSMLQIQALHDASLQLSLACAAWDSVSDGPQTPHLRMSSTHAMLHVCFQLVLLLEQLTRLSW